ncbi:MAG: UvrD-helicase domain-containing protein [Mailhella sp.]|nr:UvrD-helicase domain-containing protein [Mailhella sp.]
MAATTGGMMSDFRQIKASAGSGKTYALTEHFLSLLAGASDAPWNSGREKAAPSAKAAYGWQELLAMTFTNKAAAEMRDRVLARLKNCALGLSADPYWTKERAEKAVDTLIRRSGALNIRTIDSLLHLVVRASALDFDLSPDFTPLFSEKDVTGPLFDRLAEDARAAGGEQAAVFIRACSHVMNADALTGFLNGDRLREKVLALVSLMLANSGWRLSDLATPDEYMERTRELCRLIRRDAGGLLSAIADERLSASANLRKALEKCTAPGSDAPDDMPWKSAMFAKNGLDDCMNKASKGCASPRAAGLYLALCGYMAEMHVLMKARSLMPLVELARSVYASLQEYELAAGRIAASQIPGIARSAAGGNDGNGDYDPGDAAALFCRMGVRSTHILIDEFQDTSREQWAAIRPFAEEALSQGGSLTIVGDVKQAIYGWRGGDASLFEDAADPKSRTASLAGGVRTETLPFNWRSRERIVAWNNALFSRIADAQFAAKLLKPLECPDPMLLARHTEMLARAFRDSAQRADKCASGGMVRLFDLQGKDGERVLPEMVPDLVESLGNRRRWGDICILTRTGKQAAEAASWLMARRIPVVTQGSLRLAEQPVVSEFVELFRFLNDPEDDTAFWNVATGRHILPPSPETMPGITQLEEWASALPHGKGIARLFRRDFPMAWESIFEPILDDAGLITPYDLAMELLERWDIRQRCPESEGFLQRFLEVVFNAEENGFSDLTGFLEFWDESGTEEKAPLPDSMDAVSIMTMHTAKGLEFKAVLLPWLNEAEGRRGDGDAVFRMCGSKGVLVRPFREMGAEWYEARLTTLREAVNLLYVAMTRAVEELHCFIPSPETGPFAAMLDTLLSGMREGMAPDGEFSIWGERPAPAESPASIPGGDTLPEEDASAPADGAGSQAGAEQPLRQTSGALPAASPEAAVPAASGKAEALPEVAGGPWRPMGWLPRLRIFHSPLESVEFTPKTRGTIAHRCLEFLHVSGSGGQSARKDAALAVSRGLAEFPAYAGTDMQALRRELTDALAWYAALPETAGWLSMGDPEHPLLDAGGRQFRVDLLVDEGPGLTAVEYKTGSPREVPDPEHLRQISNYLSLLAEATGRPAKGALVYLDLRRVISV